MSSVKLVIQCQRRFSQVYTVVVFNLTWIIVTLLERLKLLLIYISFCIAKERAIRLISSGMWNAHTSLLVKYSSILKLYDLILLISAVLCTNLEIMLPTLFQWLFYAELKYA